MKSHIIFLFEEIKAGEFQELGEGPKHISEDCIQQCAMLCLNIPGTHNSLIAVITYVGLKHNNVTKSPFNSCLFLTKIVTL